MGFRVGVGVGVGVPGSGCGCGSGWGLRPTSEVEISQNSRFCLGSVEKEKTIGLAERYASPAEG